MDMLMVYQPRIMLLVVVLIVDFNMITKNPVIVLLTG